MELPNDNIERPMDVEPQLVNVPVDGDKPSLVDSYYEPADHTYAQPSLSELFGCVICAQVCTTKLQLLQHCEERHSLVIKEEKTSETTIETCRTPQNELTTIETCQTLQDEQSSIVTCQIAQDEQTTIDTCQIAQDEQTTIETCQILQDEQTAMEICQTSLQGQWLNIETCQTPQDEQTVIVKSRTPQDEQTNIVMSQELQNELLALLAIKTPQNELKTTMPNQMLQQASEGPYQCTSCGVKLLLQRDLELHRTILHHCNGIQPKTAMEKVDPSYILLSPTNLTATSLTSQIGLHASVKIRQLQDRAKTQGSKSHGVQKASSQGSFKPTSVDSHRPQHTQEITIELPFQCVECGIMLQFSGELELHMKIEHWFNSKSENRSKKAEMLFTMFLTILQSSPCTSEYELALLWRQHFLGKSTDHLKAAECPLCMKSVTNIIGHLRTHKDEITLVLQGRLSICSYCWVTLDTPESLIEHVMKTHEEETSGILNTNNAPIDDSCREHCLRSQDELVLKWRKVLSIVNTTFFCDNCGMHFPCLDDLKTHKVAEDTCTLTNRTFQCDVCNRTYSDYMALHNHIENHLNLRRIFCPVCKRAFVNKYQSFLAHSHDNQKRHICDLCTVSMEFKNIGCPMEFKSAISLTEHIYMEHQQGKWMVCHICGDHYTKTRFAKHYKNKHSLHMKELLTSDVLDNETKEKICVKCKSPKVLNETHICTFDNGFEDPKWFCCTLCEDVKYFTKLSGLLRHNKSQHNIEHLETSVDALDIPKDTDEAEMYELFQTKCNAEEAFQGTKVQYEVDDIQCPLCTAVIHISNLFNHITCHRNNMTLCAQYNCFMCSWCFMCFSTCTALVEHATEFHPEESAKSKKGVFVRSLYTSQQSILKKWSKVLDVVKDGFACNSCRKHFPTPKSAQYHTQISCHPVSDVMICSHCYLNSKFYSGHREHLVKMHYNGGTKKKCPDCDRFISTRRLIAHIQIKHNNVFPFKCDPCGEHFRCSSALVTHNVHVHNEKRTEFMCEICGYTTKKKACLVGHMNKHTGESYKCKYCDATFQHSVSKYRHERNHRDRPKYSCSKCPSTFVQKASLNRHMKTHDKLRYVCDVCDKTYSQTHPIIQHRKKCHPWAPKLSASELLVKDKD